MGIRNLGLADTAEAGILAGAGIPAEADSLAAVGNLVEADILAAVCTRAALEDIHKLAVVDILVPLAEGIPVERIVAAGRPVVADIQVARILVAEEGVLPRIAVQAEAEAQVEAQVEAQAVPGLGPWEHLLERDQSRWLANESSVQLALCIAAARSTHRELHRGPDLTATGNTFQ